MNLFSKLSLFLCLLVFGIRLDASTERLAEVEFKNDQQEVVEAATKNDLADAMLAKPSLPANFASDFIALLDDPKQGTIWHNYLLQKLDTLYMHSDAVGEREVILKRLWKESRSPTPTFAGTTLMTLQRLHESRPGVVDAAKLAKHAKWVSERDSYSNSDRLSALHVLAAFDFDTAATIARTWLQDASTPLLLKTTAIAVLGKEQQPFDTALIESYLTHPDLRLRTAAKAALEQEDSNNDAN
jgi:hypothetical protein